MLCTSPPSCIRGTHGDIGDAAQVVLAGVQCHVHTLEDEGASGQYKGLNNSKMALPALYMAFS